MADPVLLTLKFERHMLKQGPWPLGLTQEAAGRAMQEGNSIPLAQFIALSILKKCEKAFGPTERAVDEAWWILTHTPATAVVKRG